MAQRRNYGLYRRYRLIYFTVLLPFSQPFPMEKSIWFSNVINIWNHLITPVFFVALWFSPVIRKKVPTVKYGFLHLIYPACYFVWSVILGAVDGFYPYPFLSGRQMWDMLFKAKEYNSAAGVLILCIAFIILALIFFGVSCALSGIHNRRVEKLTAKEKETVTK